MKLKALATLVTAVLAFGVAQSQIQPLKWVEITGTAVNGAAAYIDTNSHSRENPYTEKDYTSAVILLEFDKPQQTIIEEEKIVYTSLARHIFVDCNSGVIAPNLDYYFNKTKPTREDTPLAVFKFDQTAENYGRLSKKSALFKTVCAFYI